MQHQTIPINPALLQWARTQAGLSLDEAAKRAKITSPRQKKGEGKLSPENRLALWENGKGAPSLTQLKNIAKIYHRPLLTFFLPKPPKQTEILADFRTLPHTPGLSNTPQFAALQRQAIMLHRELKALALSEGSPTLPFVGSYSISLGVNKLVDLMRNDLKVNFDCPQKSEDTFFSELRNLVHNLGNYVVLMGNLGSHHSKVEPE
ncbi:MAG: helix-turn-helix transcriptional regulator, partial [Candidatus Adiutrix sp.]